MIKCLEDQYRLNYGKLVSSLVSYFGIKDITIAEDIVQDTFAAAAKNWDTMLPDDPEAWLFKVCKNKAINFLRKEKNQSKVLSLYEQNLGVEDAVNRVFLPHEIRDNKLRLIFALSHPKLSQKTQVVLILRIIIGFTIQEISSGLGLSPAAIKKILVRGKQQIRNEGIALKVPYVFKSKSRLAMVHKVLYLIFNEGYNASTGHATIKQELCFEAYTLTRTLIEEGINDSMSHALMSLMIFNIARMPARVSSDGRLIDLESQDRSVWDKDLIRNGYYFLKKSRSDGVLSDYHLEAGIAGLHCTAPSFDSTDWCTILSYYDELFKIKASSYVWLNRCIALSYCKGPQEALDELIQSPSQKTLIGYYLYYITLGKLYLKLEMYDDAVIHLQKGYDLAPIEAEKKYINDLIQLIKIPD